MTMRQSIGLYILRVGHVNGVADIVVGVIVIGVVASGTSVIGVGDVVIDVGEMDIQVVFCREVSHDSKKGVGLAFVLCK